MSRLVGRPVEVICDNGVPVAVFLGETGRRDLPLAPSQELRVIGLVAHWREWIGVLDGEPERDVWQVETPRGTCELHCLRHPTDPAECDRPGRGGSAPTHSAGRHDRHPPLEPGEDEPGEWLLYRWDD